MRLFSSRAIGHLGTINRADLTLMLVKKLTNYLSHKALVPRSVNAPLSPMNAFDWRAAPCKHGIQK
jgi:hypothetical protein